MQLKKPGKFEDLAKTFSRKELPDSEVEMAGDVPYETIAAYRDTALAHIASELELPGFRKGKVTADLALKKVGELAVLEEATELFMQDFYPELIEAHKVDAVGRPQIQISKLAPNNPVGLVVRAAVYPEVTLPKDWKKIGDSIPLEAAAKATDEEVNQTLEDLRKSRAPQSEILDAEGKPLPSVLPELNDEFAKNLGAFNDLNHLKEEIKKGITEEKARKARDTRRGKIVDALVEKTTVAVPKIFVESELDKIMSQMREDIGRMGLSFEDYLKHAGKSEEGVRNEFRDQASKRAKLQLTLNKIANEEKIEAEGTAVEAEMKHALEHFPDANPALVRIHIETVLRNEAVLRMLEGSTEPIAPTTHDHQH